MAIFYFPKPGFFSTTKLGYLKKKLELLLQPNITDSDNTEFAH